MGHKSSVAAALMAGFVAGTAAQAEPFQQCNGVGWQGPRTCVDGYFCSEINHHWSWCLPDPVPAPTSTEDAQATITAVPRQVDEAPTGTSPGSTLVSGWYWIRGVAAPNFHSYLQTKPTGVPSDSFLDAASNAGQFNVIDGQLVYNTGAGGELYMHVENPEDKTQRKLETWFSEEENDYGEFGFQGDTLTWHKDDIARPNEAAWLVCEDQQLFINTGAYLYETPAGCADQTIHYYNGATADV